MRRTRQITGIPEAAQGEALHTYTATDSDINTAATDISATRPSFAHPLPSSPPLLQSFPRKRESMTLTIIIAPRDHRQDELQSRTTLPAPTS